MATPFREPVSKRWFVPAVLALIAVATPWYLPLDVATRFWHGLPVWVWVALSCALGLSVLTCYGALALWRDANPQEGSADAVPTNRKGVRS